MNLLVTGGAGFIGSAFVRRRLARSNDSIIVLDKLTYAGTRANLEQVARDPRSSNRMSFVVGDICDRSIVETLIADVDAVVNFAAESHVDRSILDSEAFLRTGVLGIYVLLDALRAVERPIRFVQVSTDEVYGSVETGYSREDDALAPSSPYAAAKAAGEMLVSAYRTTYGADAVITRGSNTYGPYQHPEKLIPLFTTNALADRPLPLYGDGLHRRDWLFVDDHADAVGFVLDHGAPGAVYNVPAGVERSNRELAEALLNELGKPCSLIRYVEDRPGHDRRYAMDGARLSALGWRPLTSFEDGLHRTVDWFRDHREWWSDRQDADWDRYYERQYAKRLRDTVAP